MQMENKSSANAVIADLARAVLTFCAYLSFFIISGNIVLPVHIGQ